MMSQRMIRGSAAVCGLFALGALGAIYHALWTTLKMFDLWQEAAFVSVFRTVAWQATVELLGLTTLAAVMAWIVLRKRGRQGKVESECHEA